MKYFIRKLFQSPGLWKSCIPAFLFPFTLHAQSPLTETRFLHYLNTWQADSLNTLITDDFTYGWPQLSHIRYNRSDFLNGYLKVSRECKGRFSVAKWLDAAAPARILLSDSSFWFYSGEVPASLWIMTIYKRNQLIYRVDMDTTAGYKKYKQAMELEYRRFELWLHSAHPGEETEKLYETPGLFLRRRAEFYKR